MGRTKTISRTYEEQQTGQENATIQQQRKPQRRKPQRRSKNKYMTSEQIEKIINETNKQAIKMLCKDLEEDECLIIKFQRFVKVGSQKFIEMIVAK